MTKTRSTQPLRFDYRMSILVLAVVTALCSAQRKKTQPADAPDVDGTSPSNLVVDMPRSVSDAWKRFSELDHWEDGLSEMSYYDATCTLYNKQRSFTRVHLFNRQYMDAATWTKATDETESPLGAFKFVITEEVPAENYNYRFLTTVFLERPSLEPLKVSVSSQEWCGHTYKSLMWTRDSQFEPSHWSLDICSFSYFGGEGDRWWPSLANVDAYESVFVFARAVVASGGESRAMHLLRTLRSNHAADPNPIDATLRIDGAERVITVPLGQFNARRVALDWTGPETWFDVESEAPYRLLAFRAGDVKARLRFVERRAYWDRRWRSGFHEPNHAP